MRLLKILCFVLVFLAFGSVLAQITDVEVILPINGQFVFDDNGSQIYLIDTFSGHPSLIVNYADGRLVRHHIFSPQGDQIAYLQGRVASTIFDINLMSSQEIQVFPGRERLFYPMSWVNSNILYYNPILGAPGTGTYTLNLMDTTTEDLSLIFSYDAGQITSDFPLPTGINQFRFSSIRHTALNPIYDEWLVIQLEGSDPTQIVTDHNGTHELNVRVNVLWNYVSGEMLSLDHLFSELVDQSSILVWKADGKYLLVPTYQQRSFYYDIVHFHNVGGNWSLDRVIQTQMPQVTLYDWLGAGSLFIVSDYTSDELYNTYQIAEIINGTWYSTDFFRISKNTYPIVRWGDWHLSATQEERYQLSCLFDQALPARISVGERARVNFTDGTPLRLRTEPDFDAPEVTQMAEGTEFDIIGGSACVNASDYYRFWQVQLDDGTTGWTAEANTTDYFIEPF